MSRLFRNGKEPHLRAMKSIAGWRKPLGDKSASVAERDMVQVAGVGQGVEGYTSYPTPK